jgi:hypothetical protein
MATAGHVASRIQASIFVSLSVSGLENGFAIGSYSMYYVGSQGR